MKSSTGRAGCGCLITVLVIFLVTAAAMIHPFSLRLMAGRLIYKDPIVTSDAILVPYFPEDKNGELFMDAFREFWAGNGKSIVVEEQRVFGLSLTELVRKLAKERGIKEPVITKIDIDAAAAGDPVRLKEKISGLRLKKVIVVVPDYASQRFHAAFNASKDEGKTLYLIRPVTMSYFAKDRWWKDPATRRIVASEAYGVLSFYVNKFIGGRYKPQK
jgi:hypothetical protein